MPRDSQASPAPSDSAAKAETLKALLARSQAEFEVEFYESILANHPAYPEVLSILGQLLTNLGNHQRALAIDRMHAQIRPTQPVVLYNLACSQSLCGQLEEALDTLKVAVAHGYDDLEHLGADPDLYPLHDYPPFIQWFAEQTLPDMPRYC